MRGILTSIESDAMRGGAVYNFSGIQCVGPADTGDALYAIDRAVFRERRMTLPGLVELMRKDIPDEKWLLYFRGLDKFGNDEPEADGWTRYVIAAFDSALGGYTNARGGRYVTGLYSVTAHQSFGKITGALPHGCRRGEAFASGIAPVNGTDRKGPTALLNSVNSIDFTQTANGVNLNLQFDRALFSPSPGSRFRIFRLFQRPGAGHEGGDHQSNRDRVRPLTGSATRKLCLVCRDKGRQK